MRKKNKLFKKIILGVVVLLIVCLLGYLIYIIGCNIYENNMKKNLKDIKWVDKNVEITSLNSFGDDIYSVKKHKRIDVWNMNYQEVIDNKIVMRYINSASITGNWKL